MSTDRILALLESHRLVGGMVDNQSGVRHEIVQSLVSRQHEAELLAAVRATSPDELARTLEDLPASQSAYLWSRLPDPLAKALLWELSEPARVRLAPDDEPEFDRVRMRFLALIDGRLQALAINRPSDLKGVRPLWVDLVNASAAERKFIGSCFQVVLPDPVESTELDMSARFYLEDEDDAIHLHSNFLRELGNESRSVPVAFILRSGTLFSIRNEELPSFRLQRQRARIEEGYVSDCVDVLIDLYAADLECSADSLESIYSKLSEVSQMVLSESLPDDQAAVTLSRVAEEESRNGRIRSNILDTQRALNFLMRSRVLTQAQSEEARQIQRNIESLNSHTAFLFDKINFLLDATIGFININQNKRVNQLTAVSVVLMPVNILAGIGGMSEFTMMTEGVPWPIAYSLFASGAAMIGFATFLALRLLERRRLSRAQALQIARKSTSGASR